MHLRHASTVHSCRRAGSSSRWLASPRTSNQSSVRRRGARTSDSHTSPQRATHTSAPPRGADGWPSGKMGALLARPSKGGSHTPRAEPALAELAELAAQVPRSLAASIAPTTRRCSVTSSSSSRGCSRRAWRGCTSSRTQWATACFSMPSTCSSTYSRPSGAPRAAHPPQSLRAATPPTVAPLQELPQGRRARCPSAASSCFTQRQISTSASATDTHAPLPLPPPPLHLLSPSSLWQPPRLRHPHRRGNRHLLCARPLPRRFVKSDYAALRRVCANITMYCDLKDTALFLAEGLVLRSTILRRPLSRRAHHSCHTAGGRWARPTLYGLACSTTQILIAALCHRPATATPAYAQLARFAGFLRTSRQKLMGGGNRCAAPNRFRGYRALGLHPDCLIHQESSAPLDMDVYVMPDCLGTARRPGPTAVCHLSLTVPDPLTTFMSRYQLNHRHAPARHTHWRARRAA